MSKLVGHVEWEITNRWGKDRGKGAKDLFDEDFRVSPYLGKDGERCSFKSFEVTPPFWVGLSAHPEQKLSGFGLSVESKETHVFAWEWFHVLPMGRAHKIQEKGELAIVLAEGEQRSEIRRIEFLTDVSIRVMKFGINMVNPLFLLRYPDWRIRMIKGSWFELPPD